MTNSESCIGRMLNSTIKMCPGRINEVSNGRVQEWDKEYRRIQIQKDTKETGGEQMASYDFLEMKQRHPDWIWPRSDTHMVVGLPGTMECYKTWVEPGNSLSPGIASFGISIWIYDHANAAWYIPEKMEPEALQWSFQKGKIPVVVSRWDTGSASVESRIFQTVYDKDSYLDTMRLFLGAEYETQLDLYLVIHSYGPCGGFIGSLEEIDDRNVQVNGFPLIQGFQSCDDFGVVDFEEGEQDICTWLMQHKLPERKKANQKEGWCSGAMRYRLVLNAGEVKELAWNFPVYLPVSRASELVDYKNPPRQSAQFWEERACEYWDELLGKFAVQVPDARFHDAFYGTLLHMLVMITGGDVRIETSFYPLFWLRDGVYILNVLEKTGLSRLAEQTLKRLEDIDFAGGFGAEADAPAEGIWALWEHYRFGRDKEWLRRVYPAIRRKAAWIGKMLDAKEDIFDCSVEMVTDFIRAGMVCGLVCHPAKDGLIQGVMDHHIPVYWINCWAVSGLYQAAECAAELGESEDAAKYRRLADGLRTALYEYYPENFLETPELQGIYSFGCALWPTRAFEREMVREKFDEWWDSWRCPGGNYHPGFDWTYFEAAQAHNYLLLGQRERFLIMLERYYADQDVPGLYGYNEGRGATERGKPTYGGQDWGFGNTLAYRGWDLFTCNMPHNWVSAELFLMMRDALLYEEDETLVIGAGIPEIWMDGKAPVKVRDLPTCFGRVSYEMASVEGELVFTLWCTGTISCIRLELSCIGVEKEWNDTQQVSCRLRR